MIYYNDLPRLLERLSENNMEQNSCLRGAASLAGLLVDGNGMMDKFNTLNAYWCTNFTNSSNTIYDYGDCTMEQLLFGHDERLEEQVYSNTGTYLVHPLRR